MINSISIYKTSFKGNQDNKYNKYGEQKSLKDPNNPSNKALARDSFVRDKSETKDKIKSLFLLLFFCQRTSSFTPLHIYIVISRNNITNINII